MRSSKYTRTFCVYIWDGSFSSPFTCAIQFEALPSHYSPNSQIAKRITFAWNLQTWHRRSIVGFSTSNIQIYSGWQSCIEAFTSPEDQEYLFPVRFPYDYIGDIGKHFKSLELKGTGIQKLIRISWNWLRNRTIAKPSSPLCGVQMQFDFSQPSLGYPLLPVCQFTGRINIGKQASTLLYDCWRHLPSTLQKKQAHWLHLQAET